MKISDPNMELDGFFEGVYDTIPDVRNDQVNAEILWMSKPVLSRGDLSTAHPALFGFPKAVDKHLPGLSFPYHQTNTLTQLQLQFWLNPEDRTLVPDGYEVEYSRSGRAGEADQTKYLGILVLKKSMVEAVAETDRGDDTVRRWQRVAEVGQTFGNAVLASHAMTHSYRTFTGGSSNGKQGELKPVTDPKLAEEVFKTVVYWK